MSIFDKPTETERLIVVIRELREGISLLLTDGLAPLKQSFDRLSDLLEKQQNR